MHAFMDDNWYCRVVDNGDGDATQPFLVETHIIHGRNVRISFLADQRMCWF